MNSHQVLALFEQVGAITAQMLEAARASDWDRLTVLESACSAHIEVLRRDPSPVVLPDDFRVRKIALIKKILADDRAIRDLISPWMAELSRRISSTGTERKLHSTYGSI